MDAVNENYYIRSAELDDVPEIFVLIKELADYERLLDEVVATEKQLGETLFGENSNVEVLLAYDENQILGFALYFQTYSTFLGRQGIYLEDLFVRKFARGKGIGQALLQRIAKCVMEMGGGRLEWSVLDWNESAISFYKKIGAVPLDGWTTFRVNRETLEKLAAL
jgi:Acetyltransferases